MSLKVSLVNMPFASLSRPSIGLTQLKSVTKERFGEAVDIDIHYFNHVFGDLLGCEAYALVANSSAGHVTGFGEWFFRQAAFPDLPDNQAAYLARFGHQFSRQEMRHIEEIWPLRAQLPQILDDLIVGSGLDQADVVGLTSMFFQNIANFAIARRLRKFRQSQTIVMGGANCEEDMGLELARQATDIDFIFSGHSLVSFPDFIGCVAVGDIAACHNVKGVFSSKNLHNIRNPASDESSNATPLVVQHGGAFEHWRAPELDINDAVVLDYDDFFDSFDMVLKDVGVTPDLPFETSRGCWWGAKAHCTFCGLNGGGMAYRAMKPALAITYIGRLIQRYADRTSIFSCVDNIMPREYFSEVWPKLQLPEEIELFYEVKADLTEQQIRVLRQGQVKKIQPGIESLATATLKHMRKGTTAFNNIRLLLDCLAYGVWPDWNLLVGFPSERCDTYEQYIEKLPDLFHLIPPSGVYPVRFDRFSPYFMNSETYGLRLEPYEYYKYCWPFSNDSLMQVAYYFQDTNIDADYIGDLAISFAGLLKVVEQWRARWAGGHQPPKLVLTQEDGQFWVTDTRMADLRRLPLSEQQYQVLKAARDPVDEQAVRRIYGEHVTVVQREGLVFSERGRIMSIVTNVDLAAAAMGMPCQSGLAGCHDTMASR